MTTTAAKAEKGKWYKTPKGSIVQRVAPGLFKTKEGKKLKLAADLKLTGAVVTKKKPDSSDDDGEAELRRMHERYKKKEETGQSGDFESDVDQLDEGDNERRVLAREGTKDFSRKIDVHYNIGPQDDPDAPKKNCRCLASKNAFNDCQPCLRYEKERARVNKKYPRGSEEGKAAWRKIADRWQKKTRFLFNVQRPEPQDVKVHICGDMIMESLLGKYFNPKIGDFTDPETGRNLNFKKVKLGKAARAVKYDVESLDRSELENAEEVLAQRHDLDEIADKLFPKLSPEEQLAIMNGEDVGDDDSASDSDSSSVSDDDDGPPADEVAAEDAVKGEWYTTPKGTLVQARGKRTPEGKYVFVRQDDKKVILGPEVQLSIAEPPSEEEGDEDESEDD